MYAIHEDGVIAERFRCRNFYLEDKECSSKLAVIDDDLIEKLIKNNPG